MTHAIGVVCWHHKLVTGISPIEVYACSTVNIGLESVTVTHQLTSLGVVMLGTRLLLIKDSMNSSCYVLAGCYGLLL